MKTSDHCEIEGKYQCGFYQAILHHNLPRKQQLLIVLWMPRLHILQRQT